MKIKQEISYRIIKCLVLSAYYLGQDIGLKGHTFAHPDAREERRKLVDFIMNPPILK
jgi:hypothetical protein